MSDRRRNLFILLVVLGLVVASAVIVVSKSTRLGLDLQGGVQLVYEGRPTKQQPVVNAEGLDRALDIMRDRVDALGVSEPELQRSGENQIDVALPGVSDAERAERQVGTTSQLYFYDWEPNILDEDCRTNPEQVNGGQQPISGLFNAVKRASQCKGEVDANNTTDGDLYYAFDRQSKQPLNEGLPEENRDDLERQLEEAGQADNAQILKVPEGIIVLRDQDERDPEQRRGEVDSWWVLKDNPVLSGTDIKNPEQGFEQGSGGAPNVTMEFTDKGREAFAKTTRAIAQRGADNAAINGGLQNPIDASHRFAIRLDNELDLHPVHQLPRDPGRHRRRPGRADLRRLPTSRPRRTLPGCSRSARCRCGWS